jgi:hypothetical protein
MRIYIRIRSFEGGYEFGIEIICSESTPFTPLSIKQKQFPTDLAEK